jgi:hypothetical protein
METYGEWMYRSTYSWPRHWLDVIGPLGTHCKGGWVGPRTGLDDVEKKKSYLYRDSNSDPLVVQPAAVTIPTALSRKQIYCSPGEYRNIRHILNCAGLRFSRRWLWSVRSSGIRTTRRYILGDRTLRILKYPTPHLSSFLRLHVHYYLPVVISAT